MVKKPYIKKISEIAGFSVWLVNGYWIRRKLEKDFTNYAQHYQFSFIPENEFWIDLEATKKKEIDYYIQSMLIMNKMIKERIPRKKAAKIACDIEEAEREKSKVVQRLEKEKNNQEKIIKKIHKTFMKRVSSEKCKVWLVKGELVRALFYTDFTQGGHEFVYEFVPKGEVWIDDDLYKKEIPFVLIHELHERALMSKGVKYDPAHAKSNILEYSCRNNPKKTQEVLDKEIKINKNI